MELSVSSASNMNQIKQFLSFFFSPFLSPLKTDQTPPMNTKVLLTPPNNINLMFVNYHF